jgi:hypothetical protein
VLWKFTLQGRTTVGKETRYQKTKTGQVAVTVTSGSLPTPTGAFTIANSATPTVVELLRFCTELKAKLDALTR